MRTKLYRMTQDNLDTTVFDELLEHKMYTPSGVLKEVYSDPQYYCDEELYLGVMSYKRKPISMCFVAKNKYFGWDCYRDEVRQAFGMVAFYTKPEFRKMGNASSLFKEFDRTFKLRKLGASPRAVPVMKSVLPEDLVVISGA